MLTPIMHLGLRQAVSALHKYQSNSNYSFNFYKNMQCSTTKPTSDLPGDVQGSYQAGFSAGQQTHLIKSYLAAGDKLKHAKET